MNVTQKIFFSAVFHAVLYYYAVHDFIVFYLISHLLFILLNVLFLFCFYFWVIQYWRNKSL